MLLHPRTAFRCSSAQFLFAVKKAAYRLLAKVTNFGINLESYFKIMEIFCGSHPEWSNIALGALLLVLKLASHYGTFFERLCDVVSTVPSRLSRYQQLYNELRYEPTVQPSFENGPGEHLHSTFRVLTSRRICLLVSVRQKAKNGCNRSRLNVEALRYAVPEHNQKPRSAAGHYTRGVGLDVFTSAAQGHPGADAGPASSGDRGSSAGDAIIPVKSQGQS